MISACVNSSRASPMLRTPGGEMFRPSCRVGGPTMSARMSHAAHPVQQGDKGQQSRQMSEVGRRGWEAIVINPKPCILNPGVPV